jgi:hypothetical protein
MGDGKSDIGSFADCILTKSSHLNAYCRRRLLFRQKTAIHFDLPVANITLRKWEGFHRCLFHNFHYECRKAVRRHTVIATDQMDREFAFFRRMSRVYAGRRNSRVTCTASLLHAATNSLFWFVRTLIFSGTPLHGMPTERPMPELAIPDVPWNGSAVSARQLPRHKSLILKPHMTCFRVDPSEKFIRSLSLQLNQGETIEYLHFKYRKRTLQSDKPGFNINKTVNHLRISVSEGYVNPQWPDLKRQQVRNPLGIMESGYVRAGSTEDKKKVRN